MFVIPMMGKSSRFFNKGYKIPKYQLNVCNKSLFYLTINSFKKYFLIDKFIFITRNSKSIKDFIVNEINETNISDFEIICLNDDTDGQAHTVYQATKGITNQELYIFNVDTILTNFIKYDLKDDEYGYLEVFKDNGAHWSFIKNDAEKVTKVTEKIKISDLCSDGLYYFKNSDDFNRAFLSSYQNDNQGKEIYVAPLYNQLINEGKKITFKKIRKDEIIFSGTPEEYESIPVNVIKEFISKL